MIVDIHIGNGSVDFVINATIDIHDGLLEGMTTEEEIEYIEDRVLEEVLNQFSWGWKIRKEEPQINNE